MDRKAIDPQSIRNVTMVGDPAETARIGHRLCGGAGETGTFHWVKHGVEYAIHLTELSPAAPPTQLQRVIRTAEGVIAIIDAGARRNTRLDTVLRIADDHQVARLCLITGLDHPAADFDHCLRALAGIRGAVPVALQLPIGAGPEFAGVIDLLGMWALEPMGVEFYGDHWALAQRSYSDLVATVLESEAGDTGSGSPAADRRASTRLPARVRRRTHLGDLVPVLCDGSPWSDDITALLDAVVGYLPSPLEVCQPEHVLDN